MSADAALKADPGEIRRALELLCDPGEVYELRALETTKATICGYFDDLNRLAEDAAAASDRFGPKGVYLTPNPVKRDLLARSANKAQPFAKYATADIDIIRRRWLPLDFDPWRPAGISSTNAEHTAALERAMTVRETLTGLTARGESQWLLEGIARIDW